MVTEEKSIESINTMLNTMQTILDTPAKRGELGVGGGPKLPNAVVRYEKMHSKKEADKHYKNIITSLDKLSKNDKGIMYGKDYIADRKTVQIADKGIKLYKYASSGSTHVYHWNDKELGEGGKSILKIKKDIETKLGAQFNFVLVNIYIPKAYLGYHSDDERDMLLNSIIASFSLGPGERDFLLKHKKTGKVTKLFLENGSLTTMEGSCQKVYKHAIPKRAHVNGIRVNLTFRQMRLLEKKVVKVPKTVKPKVVKSKPADLAKSAKSIDLTLLTVKKLKEMAKKAGHTKYSKLKKAELISLIETK